MNWLALLKFGLPAAILAFVSWAVIDRFAKAAQVAGFERCETAAKTPFEPIEDCPRNLAARIRAARAAAACDTAIGSSDLYAIRAACGEQVKRQHAALTAATTDLANVRADLKSERESRAAAIASAEQRAATTARRIAGNEQAIESAPRHDDGRVRCDAECLRRLAGD